MIRLPRLFGEASAVFVVLAIATVIVYGHVTLGLWQGRTPGQFDVRHYFVPMSFLFDFAIHTGEFPAWNPFSFSGTPFAANPQSVVFYPPQLLRSLLTFDVTPLNTYYGLVALIALQSIVGGIGTYFFARGYKLGPLASIAAALTFTFGVCLTRRVVALQFASTLMWIPFLMIAFRCMLRSRDPITRFFYTAGCGLLLALSILSGFVHIHIYIAVMIGAYWIVSRVAGLDIAGKLTPRLLARDALHIVVLFGIAACISMPMLLPAAEYAGLTNRSGDEAPHLLEYETSTLPIREAMLGPLGPETPSPERSLGYRTAGLSVYILAFAGLLGTRRKDAMAMAIVFLAMLDCTLGPPFPLATLIDQFSPFQMVVPSRAFVVGSLPLALCAGFGVESICASGMTPTFQRVRTSLLVIAGGILLAASTLSWSDNALHLTAFVVFLLAATTFVRLPVGGRATACAVLFAESLIWNYRAVPLLIDKHEFIDIGSYNTPPSPRWLENARVCDPAPNLHAYTLTPVLNGYDPLYLRAVWNLMAPIYHIWNYERFLRAQEAVIENPRTYHVFKRPFWLVREYVNGPVPARDRQFAPTTTAFIQEATSLPIPEATLDSLVDSPVSESVERIPLPLGIKSTNTVFDTAGAELSIPDTEPVQLHRVLALRYSARCSGRLQLWISGGTPETAVPILTTRIAESGEQEQVLLAPLPDLTDATVSLSFEAKDADCDIDWRQAELLVDHADENALITITSRTFNTATVEIGPLESDRMLVFLDADYPGWTAYVDGAPAAILRTDDAFKGVMIGRGTHTVEFVFRSSRIRWGMAISTLALLVVCTAAIRRAVTLRPR